jgi:hypothetical protein
MHTNTLPADAVWNRILGACMFLAPITLLLSSVIFWTAGEHWGGTVRVYAFFLFIPAVLGLTQVLWERAPRAAVILRCLLLFGSAGGVGWGAADALYGAADDKGFDAATLDELHGIIETGLPLTLNLPGITFPLAMVFTGIALWRTRAVPAPAAILLASASRPAASPRSTR